jgi:hypothetical protein
VKKRAERVALQAGMALSAINIWTGAPLLAVWVGSRVATSATSVTMAPVLLVVVVLFASCLALIYALSWTSTRYDALTGRPQTVKRHVPWLRSVRGERVDYEREKTEVTLLERMLVIMVLVAVIAFEIWFFFYSPSPIAPGPYSEQG